MRFPIDRLKSKLKGESRQLYGYMGGALKDHFPRELNNIIQRGKVTLNHKSLCILPAHSKTCGMSMYLGRIKKGKYLPVFVLLFSQTLVL